MKTFAERIKAFREESGLTQEQLAKSIGVAKNTISKWECGEREPTEELHEKLADALGVTIFDLYGIEDIGTVLSDEDAALLSAAEDVENLNHMTKLYLQLSDQHQEFVRGMVAMLWRLEQKEQKEQRE